MGKRYWRGNMMNKALLRTAAEYWGPGLQFDPLPGEYDLNFRVSGAQDGVLKIMNAGRDSADTDLQVAMLEHLRTDETLPVPRLIKTLSGAVTAELHVADGPPRLAWMISRLPGQTLAATTPVTAPLLHDIGAHLARLDLALKGFTHPGLERPLKWDLSTADWIGDHLALIEDEARHSTISTILADYNKTCQPLLKRLPQQALHNDLNDHNILVTTDAAGQSHVTGLIDFGDAVYGPVLADVAIAGAYMVLDTDTPIENLAEFLRGYTSANPLSEDEVDALWPLVLMRLAVSVVNSAMMKRERPDDPYVVISEGPAWRLLDNLDLYDPGYIRACLRRAAGLGPGRAGHRVRGFLDQTRGAFAPMFAFDLNNVPVLNYTPTGAQAPLDPFKTDIPEMTTLTNAHLSADQTGLGRYAEPRLIYSEPMFQRGPHRSSPRRSIHMGIDIFAPAGTPICAPLAATVLCSEWRDEHLGYGGWIILEHEIPGTDAKFCTLYGHLSKACTQALRVGQTLQPGDQFAELGAEHENGGWPPHLHLQLGVDTGDNLDWIGVAFPDELAAWRDVFPNPAALLNIADDKAGYDLPPAHNIAARRQAHVTPNLSLTYDQPLHMVRGWMQFLFDAEGRCYLDAFNNVPHVGHCHPDVVRAVTGQIAHLNTNTRYLNQGLADYAEALTNRLPDHLDTCFFVNSGSEANEIALRLARNFTGAQDVLVQEHGYHGITQTCIDLSHYKFAGLGGQGQRNWVHVADLPDPNGQYQGADAGAKYAADVKQMLEGLDAPVACFIAESFPCVGGQIIPPPGYLKSVYAHVKAQGGLNIADEVQTSLGRLGTCPWAFEYQGATPDIVVLGKPSGNGHPLGIVITTHEIAQAFNTGMEFFSTFGGSNVSCAAGLAVLDVLERDGLAQNAETVGARLLAGLQTLQQQRPLIAEARGLGLFLGVELTNPDGTPATQAADYIINRLRDHRILIGSDGPHANVLKIRPPLCFTHKDADHLLAVLGGILTETPLT
jgi:4-aminobutyrate aminotransferase-like enzyme/Ser/Thr protein kinase RdoA (MazF antagonist)